MDSRAASLFRPFRLKSLELKNRIVMAVGRAILGDPAWAAKVQDGETDTLKGFTPTVLSELF